MTDRVLVLGSGGTEERLCGALALSAHVKQVFFAPGTEGMSDSEKITRSAVITSNPAILKQFCKDHNISLVIISTKSLLTSGLMDDLSRSGVRCFGPTMKAAQLQDNKKFAKDFMEQLNIPTARWKSFTNPHKACSFITYTDFPALVVKAMTSSSGRDSHIARDKDDACRAVQQLTQDWILGSSTTIVIEERLEGKEYICLSLTDGLTLAPLPFVHISKHQLQDDASPAMIQMSEKNSKKVQENILRKAIDAMRQEGWGYKGLFGAKVMMTGKGPIVLGFICTFQDLKSQMIVPLLKPDLYEVIQSAIEEKLSSHAVMWELASMTKMDNCGPGTTAKHRDHDAGNTSAKPVSDVSESCGVIDAAPAGVAKCNKVVAFPGMAFRKDYPSVTQRRRHKIHCPEETHTKNDSFSDDAWAGPTVSKNIHQPVGRKTRYFEINTAPYKDPVFVHSSRSIGDKIKVALACNLHKSAAQSLVTTCMNDLLAQGAQTLYFVARCDCGQLSTDVTEAIEEGLALGCRLTGATVLENELKPPLDVYTDGSYHLSGFGLGIVERDHTLLRPDQMRAGDLILGIRSPGSCSSNDLSLLTDLMKSHSIQYTSVLPMGRGGLGI
ncbi:trifunctional purine biosynthetic protein adenosine-3-like [Engystomops pustulosus]|uniref:trifunctional purine biosynthetic protein adenosine-3-like n=1 Tax=Engystomops pustulosus TaxID=76066 RepID=UPI003AFA53C9